MTCLIDRENGIPADNWTMSLSKAIPPAAVSTSCGVAYGYSPNSQNSKRLPSSTHIWPLSILFCNPTSFFILDIPPSF